MQHDFLDFLPEDEDSTIAGRLSLILALLTRGWLRLGCWTLARLILSFLIFSLRILRFLTRRLRGLPLRLLTWRLLRLRLLVRCAWQLSGDCLVSACYGGGKKNNQ